MKWGKWKEFFIGRAGTKKTTRKCSVSLWFPKPSFRGTFRQQCLSGVGIYIYPHRPPPHFLTQEMPDLWAARSCPVEFRFSFLRFLLLVALKRSSDTLMSQKTIDRTFQRCSNFPTKPYLTFITLLRFWSTRNLIHVSISLEWKSLYPPLTTQWNRDKERFLNSLRYVINCYQCLNRDSQKKWKSFTLC